MERLDRVLSNRGALTRNETKKAVKAGRITVNGIKCMAADMKVDPETDSICVDGSKISGDTYVYYMFNKPAGYITAREDRSAPCVFDLIEDRRRDLTAVGRLDKDTTGLLLLTNDGEMNHRMLSPKRHVTKRYEALIDGKLTETDIKRLCEGIDIGDEKPTLPAELEILNEECPQLAALSITEGRYHQVKRMFEAVSCPVIGLHRTDFGPLRLDEELSPGEYRPLTVQELEACKKI